MQWLRGHVCVCHRREPWDESCPEVLIHTQLDRLTGLFDGYGTLRTEYHDAYLTAKFAFDLDAAYSIIERCIRPELIDAVASAVARSQTRPRLVFPHPEFDDEDAVGSDLDAVPTNALPFAFANYLAEVTGCEVDEDIAQAARVGRTKLGRWLRFLCQPSFIGPVEPRPYILIDDVATTCGTMAALRSHILRSGGTICAASALAHVSGKDQKFAVAPGTLAVLMSTYGENLRTHWLEAIGHDISCLTEAEGQFLLLEARQWGREECVLGEQVLHRLRDRLDQAAAKGR